MPEVNSTKLFWKNKNQSITGLKYVFNKFKRNNYECLKNYNSKKSVLFQLWVACQQANSPKELYGL